MSHNITEIDTVLRPEGSKYTTWHGLDQTTPLPITMQVAKDYDLLPTVEKTPLFIEVDTRAPLMVPNFRALTTVAKNGAKQTLDVVTDRYSIIQNEQVFETMSEAFKGTGLDYTLSCIGTLGGLKKFFISVAVGDDNGGFMVNGDKFHSNLNFITSHDGGSFLAHDSQTRVVCQNTLRASVNGKKKNVDFKIRHKGDTAAKCADLSRYLNDVFTSREVFIEKMETLAAVKVNASDIRQVVGGFFVTEAFKRGERLEEGFKTRSLNMIDGITDLSVSGRGNSGQSLYDALNGATEFWTSGDGVGRTASAGKKAYSSEFGTAAANKEKFAHHLTSEAFKSTSLEEDTRRILAASLNG
jgi:hypothetical protein